MTVFREKSSQQNPTQRVRFPIRLKITIPYLILSLILAAAAAYLITQLVLENVRARFNEQLYEAGKISSELMVSYESQLLQTLRLLANAEGVSTAIQSNDSNTLRALTLGIIANDHQEAVEFLDVRGSHVLSVHLRPGANPEDYEFSTGAQTTFSNLEIVQNILNQKGDANGDKFADLVQTEVEDYLYVSGPVHDPQGNLIGVVLVGRSLPTLTADMHAKTFAQITLYDKLGHELNSTLPFPHDLASGTALRTISFQDLNSTKRDISSQRDITLANIPFSEILGAWNVRGDHVVGVLGVALSQNAAVQASTSSRWSIFFLILSANFLIILIGINLADAITRPLIQLVRASVQVSRGDLGVQITTRTDDEISVLTDSFNAMVASLHKSQTDLLNAYDNTLEGWARALELRDKETEGHSKRVGELVLELAHEMGIHDQVTLANIRRGALLHDIGKMGIPDSILHKDGSLTEEETTTVRNHPRLAYDMLKKIDYLQPSLEIPFCHHEKWDGTGYPRGLKGEEIPFAARIFAIVDVWDAMTHDRPYRKAIPDAEVLSYLKDQSGKYFDPNIVDVFIRILNLHNKENA
jgi:putative nucleotidyltransferase with HDIG domain